MVELLEKSQKASGTWQCGTSCVFPYLSRQKNRRTQIFECTTIHAFPATERYFLWAHQRPGLLRVPRHALGYLSQPWLQETGWYTMASEAVSAECKAVTRPAAEWEMNWNECSGETQMAAFQGSFIIKWLPDWIRNMALNSNSRSRIYSQFEPSCMYLSNTLSAIIITWESFILKD